MAAKTMVSARLDPALSDWAKSYAKERGVSLGAVLESALSGLKQDARGGVPEMPVDDVVVPSPEQTDTADWREPTEAELESARERYPDLTNPALMRLARAEARMADMGMPQTPAAPSPDAPADMQRGTPRAGGDFSALTKARGDMFAHLRTPESIKSGKKA